MKKIVLLLLAVAPLASYSQKKVVFDTTIANTSSREFFQRNADVDSVVFEQYFKRPRFLNVYRKSIWYDTSYNIWSFYKSDFYKFDFLGDAYLLEKKYGQFQLPEKQMAMVLAKSCGPNASLKFIAKMNSIQFIMESYCFVKKDADVGELSVDNDEQKVFFKIEVGPEYKGGINVLQSQVETNFKNKRFSEKKYVVDSALIFNVLVAKDGCIKNIELVEGRYSEFVQFLMDELKVRCSWKPGLKDGRPAIWYVNIFFRLNKDKSITVGI